MKDVKGMEKNSRVGTGGAAYNGTKDQDVKEVFNETLAKHGLCILPIDINETTDVSRWEEEQTWQGKSSIKQKQSVFTKVKVKYMLLNMKYPSYIKLQTFLVIAWLLGAILTFFMAQDSQTWFFKNGPWLYPIIALIEVGEAYIAIRRAKQEFNVQQNTSAA